MNLSGFVVAYLQGFLVQVVATKHGFKKAVFVQITFTGLLNVVGCFVATFVDEPYWVMFFSYYVMFLSNMYAFTGNALGCVLLVPGEIIGQAIGFNVTIAGLVSFIP